MTLQVRRREFLAGFSLTAATQVVAQERQPELRRVQAAVGSFAKLPVTTSCFIAAEHPTTPWTVGHDPGARLFVGSAVKTFILATYLREIEGGRLTLDQQLAINDDVRSPSSPVFMKLTGTTEARSVLEAMIAHSDNTATDAALKAVGPERVRGLVREAGLSATHLPDSTRRMVSYLAGAPEGVDFGWEGIERMANGQFAGSPRSPMNDHQTMLSTAEEMVRWYQRALKGEFFRKPETLLEFKRIQAMADSLWHVVPADTLAYGKGGSIDWQDFHCFALSGQMIVRGVPLTFCFTINWTGPADGVASVFEAYKNSVAEALNAATKAIL
jgi:beta-lactamase class A